VSAALGEVGTVIAKHAAPADPDGRTPRVGWDHLLQYFQTSAPGVWPDDAVHYIGVDDQDFPNWCGIFALWAIKTGGASVGTWHMGGSVGDAGMKGTLHPAPGDMGCFVAKQHVALITQVDGDTFSTVEGNSEGIGSIVSRTRSKSEFDAGFYTAFS
jgi:hypothetical protein